jgi:hypothetical protein
MDAKHTPQPWTFDDEGMVVAGPCGSSTDQRDICYLNPETGDEKDWFASAETAIANGHRIVACVEGCEGLNPSAYREVLAALESIVELLGEDFYWDHGTVMAEVHDAITRAKGE